jgi:hypothetical protein
MDKTEIINLTEASGVSDNDYVMIDSPTLGVRKYSASNFKTVAEGGNSITYGTDTPTMAATDKDGDLYLMLNSGNKKIAEFLFMEDDWALIDGDVPILEGVVISQNRHNASTSDTYTATKKCNVLCVNINMNGEASTKSLTSSITTTGEILYQDVFNPSWSSPDRNQCTRVAIVHLEEGETVTLSNYSDGNYTSQVHLAVILSNYYEANQLTRVVSNAKSDNTYSGLQTYSLTGSGRYIAICFQTSGYENNPTTYATISTNNDSEVIEAIRGGNYASISVALVDYPNSITFRWGDLGNYATKGYAVYRLS